MPKKKCDSLSGFRIEVNDKERKLLEKYVDSVAAKNYAFAVATNTASVGAILTPVAIVGSVALGAWIAKEGIDHLLNWANRKKMEVISDARKKYDNDYKNWAAKPENQTENPVTGEPTGKPRLSPQDYYKMRIASAGGFAFQVARPWIPFL